MKVLVLLTAITVLLGGATVAVLSERPWLPRTDVVQPIPFSHRIHAGVNKIPCQYCHNAARRSIDAGLPPMSRCVGCHAGIGKQFALKPVTRPWIDSTQATFEVQWNRVYTLPDFVRFAHKPHIHAGVACQSCHGPVETMDRIEPAYEINMGFCINCHTSRGVRKDCFICHY